MGWFIEKTATLQLHKTCEAELNHFAIESICTIFALWVFVLSYERESKRKRVRVPTGFRGTEHTR